MTEQHFTSRDEESDDVAIRLLSGHESAVLDRVWNEAARRDSYSTSARSDSTRSSVRPDPSRPPPGRSDSAERCQHGVEGPFGRMVCGCDKIVCTTCGFMVRPHGHAGRCRVAVPAGLAERIRRMAWLGDAQHTADVRTYLLVVGTPLVELEVKAQDYLNRKTQAAYYREYPSPEVPAVGRSEHSLSSAFEANYYGDFRACYLRDTFGLGRLPRETHVSGPDFNFPSYLSVFFSDYPFRSVP